MSVLIKALAKSGLLRDRLDQHLVRASMVLIFGLFGYRKWFEYEVQGLIPFIRYGPLGKPGHPQGLAVGLRGCERNGRSDTNAGRAR